MNTRKLGSTGPEVYPLGLGCMGMSDMYGPADESEGIATIHEALEAGINLVDTADFYGAGKNEFLVGRALKGRRDKAILSVKFGALRGPDRGWLGQDCRPAAIKNFLAYTLQRLGVDYIDIYRPARLDPAVPIEDTVGAMAELVKAGYVRHIGLSEISSATLRRAAAVHPIVDVQIEYSLISRHPEDSLFPAMAETGVAMTAYGVLSRGLLAGSKPTGPTDFRTWLPRFAGANAVQNASLVQKLHAAAEHKGCTPSQLAIAWVLHKGADIVPLIGARTRKQLAESLAALRIPLTAQEVHDLERTVPAGKVAGQRYQDQAMAHLDSEK